MICFEIRLWRYSIPPTVHPQKAYDITTQQTGVSNCVLEKSQKHKDLDSRSTWCYLISIVCTSIRHKLLCFLSRATWIPTLCLTQQTQTILGIRRYISRKVDVERSIACMYTCVQARWLSPLLKKEILGRGTLWLKFLSCFVKIRRGDGLRIWQIDTVGVCEEWNGR